MRARSAQGRDATCSVANARRDDPPTEAVVVEALWRVWHRDNADVNCWRRHGMLASATNWLRQRVLLHTVHFASKALGEGRLISTRVIVIEGNQRFHSWVAQDLVQHVCHWPSSASGLQYVMATGRRLMIAGREA